MAELDNDLASSLAKAKKSLEKSKNPMLFAYPFELSEISALNAVNGLTDLNGDSLGVDTSVENGPPIMKTFVKSKEKFPRIFFLAFTKGFFTV